MLTETNERPSAVENYTTACNASDLTVEADRRGAADLLIAAGWSKSRLGQALIRLQSEWDGADKPRKLTDAEIEKLSHLAEYRDSKGRPDIRRARTAALIGYATATRNRAAQMRTRPEVLRLLGEWAQEHGVDPDLLSPALFHWLSPTCPVCDGHGHRKLPDAPVLGGKACHHCGGTGEWPRPLGAHRVDNIIRDCVGKAKTSLRGRMRSA